MAALLIGGSLLGWQSYRQRQTIAEVEALVAKYSAVSAVGTGAGSDQSLATAITAIAEGAAGDARYAKALDLLKAGKPTEAEPLLKAVAEEEKMRAARGNTRAAAAFKNLGAVARLTDPKRAREYYAEATALDPDDVEDLYRGGRLQFLVGNIDAADEAYNRVLALTADKAQDVDRYWSLLGLCDTAYARHELAPALEACTRAKSAAFTLAAADPGNHEWQYAMGGAYEMVAKILTDQGQLDEALDVYLKTVEITRRLAKDNPTNMRAQRSRAVAVRDVGQVREGEGNLAAAIAAYRESATIMQEVMKAHSDQKSEMEILLVILGQLGDAYRKAENLPE